jgi:chorismate mutase/predicted enzyme related to lactoylglutathione lyase
MNTNPLLDFRTQIDQIDTQILELLTQRIEVVKKVGAYKKTQNLPALDQSRWQAVLDKLELKCQEFNLDFELVKDLWNRIHEFTVELETADNNLIKPMIKLGPIVIGVKNIEKAKIFYENVFELKIESQSENYLSCYLGQTHIEIEEDSPNRFPNWEKHNIETYKNSQFIVENMGDFLKKVVENDGKIISQATNRPWGGITAEIADLDGNIFLISQE